MVDWDRSAPASEERLFGSWDVTPGQDGVDVARNAEEREIPIPPHIKAQLRKEAEREGRAVSSTKKVVYSHDLDSRETETRVNRSKGARVPENGSARESVSEQNGARVPEDGAAREGVSKNAAREGVSKNGAASEELDPRFQKILELQAKAAQGRKSGQRRRASRRADEKMPSYKLPEIVIVQNGGGWRRRVG